MGVSNSFHGTKMLLNADLPEVNDYKMKYVLFPCHFVSKCSFPLFIYRFKLIWKNSQIE